MVLLRLGKAGLQMMGTAYDCGGVDCMLGRKLLNFAAHWFLECT
jgi:hypothetical protein